MRRVTRTYRRTLAGRAAFFPDAHASGMDVSPLVYVEPSGNDGEQPERHRVEDNVRVGHGADADAGGGRQLHRRVGCRAGEIGLCRRGCTTGRYVFPGCSRQGTGWRRGRASIDGAGGFSSDCGTERRGGNRLAPLEHDSKRTDDWVLACADGRHGLISLRKLCAVFCPDRLNASF